MSFLPQKTSTQIVILLIISINFIFSYKYAARVTNYALYITIVYSLIIFWSANYILRKKNILNKQILYSLIGLYVAIIIITFVMTDPSKIKVDRWSVITSFWDGAISGIFPYQTKSHLGCYPGPCPFYFILALPFYFIGEIGYFSLMGLFVMLIDINLFFKDDYHKKVATIFLLLSSLAILWEMIARSTLLINSALILLYLMWMVRNKNHSFRHYAIMGFVGGLLLSTRGIFIIPIILCCAYCFLKPWRLKELFIFGSLLMVGFIITILPFILWDYQLFIKYNPLTLQSDIIGRYIAIALVIISVGVGFRVKN